MMDGKVSVSIRQIENGYLVDRSWTEHSGKDGHCEYKSEQYYVASLPPLIKKLFDKGNVAREFGGRNQEGDDEYERALKNIKKGKPPKKADEEDEEAPEDMEDEE